MEEKEDGARAAQAARAEAARAEAARAEALADLYGLRDLGSPAWARNLLALAEDLAAGTARLGVQEEPLELADGELERLVRDVVALLAAPARERERGRGRREAPGG